MGNTLQLDFPEYEPEQNGRNPSDPQGQIDYRDNIYFQLICIGDHVRTEQARIEAAEEAANEDSKIYPANPEFDTGFREHVYANISQAGNDH